VDDPHLFCSQVTPNSNKTITKWTIMCNILEKIKDLTASLHLVIFVPSAYSCAKKICTHYSLAITAGVYKFLIQKYVLLNYIFKRVIISQVAIIGVVSGLHTGA